MSKLVIELPPDLETFVNDQVAEGFYANAGDLVRSAVERLAADADPDYEAKLATLKEALRPGLEDARAGRIAEGTIEDFIAEFHASKKG
ncbi:MAG TPA: type II toxin-antitoxin system ParD family antitoxin [Caulobacterales bacterium]|jgi:putative addiction module CopG family antidote|nr:type II toxin-antitoxin system ParD family antitoxin [Caulobacterales bacterium]